MVLPEIESFLYLYVFTVKLNIKTGFISKSFFSKYSRWIFQCDSTLPLKTMTLTTLINTIWGRLQCNFPRVTAFFLPIVFRGIKQNIIYIYPYENSNSSRAPSNIHRTWLSQLWIHRSWQCFHTSFISSIQLVSLSLSLKFLFKIFEFYLVSHLSFRNYNLNSVDSFFARS